MKKVILTALSMLVGGQMALATPPTLGNGAISNWTKVAGAIQVEKTSEPTYLYVWDDTVSAGLIVTLGSSNCSAQNIAGGSFKASWNPTFKIPNGATVYLGSRYGFDINLTWIQNRSYGSSVALSAPNNINLLKNTIFYATSNILHTR
ncbi:hypothetical protein FJ365_04450 [Candidatus Dependentiae bacterium]|nr:hypothetical protein [Candidatus Dependentiae bacterium]